VPTIHHRSRFQMVGTWSLSSLRERNCARRRGTHSRDPVACRPYEPRLTARPRSSLVLREHDSSGVLALKSAGSESWSKLFS
jgi:hypothetical protein